MTLSASPRAWQQESCPEGPLGPTGPVTLLPGSSTHTRVSLNGTVEITTTGNKNSSYPSAAINDAGHTIIGFHTSAEDTPAPPINDNPNNLFQFWVRNDTTSATHLVSGRDWTPTGRTKPGTGPSDRGSISGNGRFVVFQSKAGNFQAYINGVLTNDDNQVDDVWIYDVETFHLSRLSSRPANGVGGGGRSWGPPEASEFGRYVAFTTRSTNLVNIDTAAGDCALEPRGGIDNIVLLDRGQSNLPVDPLANLSSRTIRWVSHGIVVEYALPGGEPYVLDCVQPNGPSEEPSLSASGCKIAYLSQATNLSLHDQFQPGTNPIWHVYVYDASTGLNQLVSKSTSGSRANGHCSWPEISADGRFVVYSSSAKNLDLADQNDVDDIFVRDLQAGTTDLMTRAGDGFPFTGVFSGSRNPELSPSGRFVTYGCRVLDPAVAFQIAERPFATVLIHDRDADNDTVFSTFSPTFDPSEIEVLHLSLKNDGTDADNETVAPLMFGERGEYIYFPSDASDLIPNDTNGSGLQGRDVFRRKVWQ